MPLKLPKRMLAAVLVGLLPIVQQAGAADVVSGTFNLVDHTGRPVSERSYDGKLRLVFFGFTHCPDVCPTTLLELSNALRELGDDAAQVQPLFISVDLDRDSPQQLARYVSAFHPTLVGLTGSKEQIAAAARSFNVTYGVTTADESRGGGRTIFHSSYLFLMDREGKLLDVFGYGTRAERIAETLRSYL